MAKWAVLAGRKFTVPSSKEFAKYLLGAGSVTTAGFTMLSFTFSFAFTFLVFAFSLGGHGGIQSGSNASMHRLLDLLTSCESNVLFHNIVEPLI